ncbi:hypothetical protein JCM8547_003127 [Rhodosporidiobolus lusitaniae]
MRLLTTLASFCLLLAVPALAAFGITSSSSAIILDSGAGLTVTISTTSGDITSILYGSKQLQDSSKKSHIASGLGSATVNYKVTNDYIVVTTTSDEIGGDLTHYTIMKNGENTRASFLPSFFYMATRAASEPDVGELRFIFRLNKSVLSSGYSVSDVEGCTAIEGSDVFDCDGETHSKFYSSKQFIDDQVHGVTGDGVGAWMVIPGTGYERSSGGPFFRDIDNQGSSQQELYFYMNSNHMQTEDYKVGLFGPYALVINDGSTPSGDLDMSFMDDLSLRSHYAESDRGYVSGTTSGIGSDYADNIVVGWKNWTRVSSSGAFTSPAMIPGTYTQTLYKMELEVAAKSSVTVTAGSTTTANIASGEDEPDVIWSIGAADGTPRSFLNADLIETMHPSDSRMSSWGPVVYSVSSDSASSWPMAQFVDVNNGNQIVFTLTEEEAAEDRTIEVGVTSSFAGGRPQVTVNSYTGGDAPSAPTKIDSRGVTRGTWRGYNIAYKTTVPSASLVAGENTATIDVISGSSGDDFLSPNIVFDYIRFY